MLTFLPLFLLLQAHLLTDTPVFHRCNTEVTKLHTFGSGEVFSQITIWWGKNIQKVDVDEDALFQQLARKVKKLSEWNLIWVSIAVTFFGKRINGKFNPHIKQVAMRILMMMILGSVTGVATFNFKYWTTHSLTIKWWGIDYNWDLGKWHAIHSSRQINFESTEWESRRCTRAWDERRIRWVFHHKMTWRAVSSLSLSLSLSLHPSSFSTYRFASKPRATDSIVSVLSVSPCGPVNSSNWAQSHLLIWLSFALKMTIHVKDVLPH